MNLNEKCKRVQDEYLRKIINFHLDSIIILENMNLYEHPSSPVVRFTINLNKIDFYDTENMVDNCKY